MKYHLNGQGLAALCKATERTCPLGEETLHEEFSTIEEAQNWAENILQEKYNTIPVVQTLVNTPMATILGKPDLDEPGFENAKNIYENIHSQLTGFQIKREMTANEVTKILDAMDVAWQLHKVQTRKGTTIPYITHPLTTVERLLSYGVKDASALSAMALHDSVEDSSEIYCDAAGAQNLNKEEMQVYTLRAVGNTFGEDTRKLVEALSTQIAADEGATEKEQNKLYQADVEKRVRESFGAFMVTYTDFMDNAGTLKKASFNDPARKTHLAEKYLPILGTLRQAFYQHETAGRINLTGSMKKRLSAELSRVQNDLTSILKAS